MLNISELKSNIESAKLNNTLNINTFISDVEILEAELARIEERDTVVRLDETDSIDRANEVHNYLTKKLNDYANLNASVEKLGEDTITIKTEDKTLLINVPYELKDNFKSTFTTAKWNGKCWTLKRRSVRLEEWVNNANKQYAIIKQKECFAELLRLQTSELEAVKNRFNCDNYDLDEKIERLENLQEDYQELLESRNEQIAEIKAKTLSINTEIEAIEAKIKVLKEPLEEAKAERENAVKSLNEANGEIILAAVNIEKLEEAKSALSSIHSSARYRGHLKSKERSSCDKYIEIIEKELNVLLEKGIVWKELVRLSNVNATNTIRDLDSEAYDLSIFTIETESDEE